MRKQNKIIQEKYEFEISNNKNGLNHAKAAER